MTEVISPSKDALLKHCKEQSGEIAILHHPSKDPHDDLMRKIIDDRDADM